MRHGTSFLSRERPHAGTMLAKSTMVVLFVVATIAARIYQDLALQTPRMQRSLTTEYLPMLFSLEFLRKRAF